jgi:pyruvate/2-oxoglutarate/acetoin dehydrogenase E1 component
MSSVVQVLNQGLHAAFAADERVLLIGEDVLDPYGGAFKVSKGLSSKYPERVITTPVSEAGIVGVAGGMALRGLRPVVEIMFGDFTTLIADQMINGLSKFQGMYNGQAQVPVVVRTPMGGRRGYGPTHSQTLEKLYLGVPGLRTLAVNTLSDPGELVKAAILEDDGPVLFVENKLLYAKELMDAEALKEFEVEERAEKESYAPSQLLRIKGAPAPALTIAAYGYMAELGREAMLRLAFEHEIFCELYVPSQLTPLPQGGKLDKALTDSLAHSGRLLTIEEGSYTLGWGAEIAARAAQQFGVQLKGVQRVAAAEEPIPASVVLEEAALPGVEDIIAAARAMV